MYIKSFSLTFLLLASSVGQLCAQQRHPHTDRIKDAVIKLSKRLPTGNIDDLFHLDANIENKGVDNYPLSPKAYFQRHQIPLQDWSIKITGKPTYYQRDPETGEWRAKVSAVQTWGKKKDGIPCVITFLVRPKQVLILDVMNLGSEREKGTDFGAVIQESDVDAPPPPVHTAVPSDIPATPAAADCSKVLADLAWSQKNAKNLGATLKEVKNLNGTLRQQKADLEAQLSKWKIKYDTLLGAWKRVKKIHESDSVRIGKYRFKEVQDSLAQDARKKRKAAAILLNKDAVKTYRRAHKDYYEVRPAITADSLQRAIYRVMGTFVANDANLAPENAFIMATILGRNEGNAWEYPDSLPGTNRQSLKNAIGRLNPIILAYLARTGLEMTNESNDFSPEQEMEEYIRNLPEYIRPDMNNASPTRDLNADLGLFFKNKDYLKAANQIRQHLPYLNKAIYTENPDSLLVNAQIKYAYGCILLWNLDDINGSKGLLSSNNKFLAEVNGRVTKGEEYLLEVIAMKQFLLRKEARTLLENGASRSKITNDKSLNSQEIEIIKVILDAKTALYKHYQ